MINLLNLINLLLVYVYCNTKLSNHKLIRIKKFISQISRNILNFVISLYLILYVYVNHSMWRGLKFRRGKPSEFRPPISTSQRTPRINAGTQLRGWKWIVIRELPKPFLSFVSISNSMHVNVDLVAGPCCLLLPGWGEATYFSLLLRVSY